MEYYKKNFRQKKVILMKQSISDKIKKFLDEFILPMETVVKLVKEKKMYLQKEDKKDQALEKFNLTKWDTFLPPLVKFSVSTLRNISPTLYETLLNDLKNRSVNQHEKLNNIYGKIRDHSFYIIEMIESIINGEDFLLITNNGEMITQNACCNMDKLTTYSYFVSKNKNIEKYNKIVNSLSDIKNEISNYSKAYYYFYRKRYQNKVSGIINNYSKENIYRTFIKYCKFNTGIKLDDTVMRICKTNNSKFLRSDSIEKKNTNIKR